MIQYYLDGVDIGKQKSWVESYTGLFAALNRKEVDKMDYLGQHGYRFDRNAIRYKEREISITLNFSATGASLAGLIRDDVKEFVERFNHNRPVRLMRVDTCQNRTDVWDVDLITENSEQYFLGQAARITITLHETAPVKAVYKCNANVANLEVDTPLTLMVSWGDGSFEKVKTETISHQYTDNICSHYIIVSGVMSDAQITTNLPLICKTLC